MIPARANERQRVSHASGAGIDGVPASECVGGSGGAKPPGQEMTKLILPELGHVVRELRR
jgi:hypothetical protein